MWGSLPARRFLDLIRKEHFYDEVVGTALGTVGPLPFTPQQGKVSSTNATCWVASFSVINSRRRYDFHTVMAKLCLGEIRYIRLLPVLRNSKVFQRLVYYDGRQSTGEFLKN